METVSLKAPINSTAVSEQNNYKTESKTDAKENKDEFSNVLKNVKETKDASKAYESSDNKVKAEDKTYDYAKDNEENNLVDINQLIQMLIMLSAAPQDKEKLIKSVESGDVEQTKVVISQLLQNTLVSKNQIDISFDKLDLFKTNNTAANIGFMAENLNLTSELSKQEINALAENIASKLVQNNSLKSEFMTILKEDTTKAYDGDVEAFKKSIIDKITTMLKEDTKKVDNLKAENIIAPAKETTFIASDNSQKQQAFVQDNKAADIEVNNKTADKVDKLLKNLITDDSKKGSKDNITDKIANIMTRFESIRVDKPLIVDEKPIINKANFNADFIKTIKYMDMNNIKELSVKIIPKDLGEIVIRLTMDNGALKANITAANKETYNLLNSQISTISNQLSEQNMNIQSFNLSLYNGDNFLFNSNEGESGQQRQQGKRNLNVNGLEDEEISSNAYAGEDNNVNILA